MTDLYKKIEESSEISNNAKYYWGYQYNLGKEVIVPYLTSISAFKPGFKVAEIGSAEGGVLASFVEKGAADALGTDIISARLELGEKINKIIDINIEFNTHDIVNSTIPDKWKQKFDLVLLRDVIEHLVDTEKALSNIKKIIKPGGFLYVNFPPYYSPFGGHQHTLNNFWGKLPYIHFFPDPIFDKLIASGRPNDIAEVKRLRNIRLTPKKFTVAASKAGFSVQNKDFYLLRPVYKMKFGLPSLKLTSLSFLPLVKNIFSLEASYLLKS